MLKLSWAVAFVALPACVVGTSGGDEGGVAFAVETGAEGGTKFRLTNACIDVAPIGRTIRTGSLNRPPPPPLTGLVDGEYVATLSDECNWRLFKGVPDAQGVYDWGRPLQGVTVANENNQVAVTIENGSSETATFSFVVPGDGVVILEPEGGLDIGIDVLESGTYDREWERRRKANFMAKFVATDMAEVFRVGLEERGLFGEKTRADFFVNPDAANADLALKCSVCHQGGGNFTMPNPGLPLAFPVADGLKPTADFMGANVMPNMRRILGLGQDDNFTCRSCHTSAP